MEKENDELREKLERQEEERIENAVADAVTDGRIGADQKDIYKNILKANFKDGMTALKALKPKRLLKDKLEVLLPVKVKALGRSAREKLKPTVKSNMP